MHSPPSHSASPVVELQSLTDAFDLVRQVKKLNLGVLPVQPPEFCYKRALRDTNHLSCAALTTASDTRNVCVVGALVSEWEQVNRIVHVRTLAVDPRYRRQGIGKQLMLRVIEQSHALNTANTSMSTDGSSSSNTPAPVTSIRLHVHVDNDDGIAFYTQLGFVEEARLENYYRHLDPPTCIVMSYALSKAQE